MLVDEISQPHMADGPSRGWANSPLVETALRHPRAPGTPPRCVAPRPSCPGSLRTAPCGHHPGSQQFVGSSGHGQVGLQLGDAAAGSSQFLLLPRRKTRLDTSVNSVLAPPVIDCLVRHAKIGRPGRHRPASSQQVPDLAAELRWISIRHEIPPSGQHTTNSNMPTPENRGIT